MEVNFLDARNLVSLRMPSFYWALLRFYRRRVCPDRSGMSLHTTTIQWYPENSSRSMYRHVQDVFLYITQWCPEDSSSNVSGISACKCCPILQLPTSLLLMPMLSVLTTDGLVSALQYWVVWPVESPLHVLVPVSANVLAGLPCWRGLQPQKTPYWIHPDSAPHVALSIVYEVSSGPSS